MLNGYLCNVRKYRLVAAKSCICAQLSCFSPNCFTSLRNSTIISLSADKFVIETIAKWTSEQSDRRWRGNLTSPALISAKDNVVMSMFLDSDGLRYPSFLDAWDLYSMAVCFCVLYLQYSVVMGLLSRDQQEKSGIPESRAAPTDIVILERVHVSRDEGTWRYFPVCVQALEQFVILPSASRRCSSYI